jgi:cytidylate kinase
MQKKIIIAVDGYSSCGKSTLARDVAHRLGFSYIDSGAMYRAAAYFFLKNNFDAATFQSKPEAEQEKILAAMQIEFRVANGEREIFLDGVNVEKEIRGKDVSDVVSSVSAIASLRKRMVTKQRKFAEEKHIVMDGRDIGTTVFPHADLKIFMTASIEVRAQRRFDELVSKGIKMTMDEVKQNIKSRDFIDTTRKISPLKQADDAIVLDNTNLTRSQQLDLVLKIIAEKFGISA